MNVINSILNGQVDQYQKAKPSKESIEGLYALAYQHYQCGKYIESGKFFRFLTLIDTESKKNWTGLGASLQMQKMFSQAIQAYNVAAILDQNDPHTHLFAADCFFALDEREKGLEAIQSAIRLAKGNKIYHELLPKLEVIYLGWKK